MDTGRRYPFSACGKLPIDCSIILCTYLAWIPAPRGWTQGRSNVPRCVSSTLRSDSLCASWAYGHLSFLRPPVGVQVPGLFTNRVYYIQLIKAIITLNNFIIYRCVSCMHI